MNAAKIRSALESVAIAELGEGFKPLSHRFSVESNDAKALENGVSAMWGAAKEVDLVDQYVGLEQDFTLTITKRTFVRNDDLRSVTEMDAIYESISRIIKIAVISRLNLPKDLVQLRLEGMTEPRPFNDNERDVIFIELNFSAQFIIT